MSPIKAITGNQPETGAAPCFQGGAFATPRRSGGTSLQQAVATAEKIGLAVANHHRVIEWANPALARQTGIDFAAPGNLTSTRSYARFSSCLLYTSDAADE